MPSSRPTVPAPRGRTRPLRSLTQPRARSGRTCSHCGDVRLTEIGMTLTDGTTVEFISCRGCERRNWRRTGDDLGVEVSFDTVLTHARRAR